MARRLILFPNAAISIVTIYLLASSNPPKTALVEALEWSVLGNGAWIVHHSK
jgi:hypothetical protein